MKKVALISQVFHDDQSGPDLVTLLKQASGDGADIAVLPELPLNRWSPSTDRVDPADAEPLGGPRCTRQSEAAAEAGITLVGGAIILDDDGSRHNTALVYGSDGHLLGTYEKCHIPDEPGFLEIAHYEPGRKPPMPIRCDGIDMGVQICSDVNRPEGSHMLGASGAVLIVAPRATELATWPRWKPVLVANALTSCCFVASVNRPSPEDGVLIGGPSFAVDPTGRILVESTDVISCFQVDVDSIPDRRIEYPGYLDIRTDLYVEGWKRLEGRTYKCVDES